MSELGGIVQSNLDLVSDQFSYQTHADLKPVKSEFSFSFFWSIIGVISFF